jgi:uroporphyrinogen-III decarboxylase
MSSKPENWPAMTPEEKRSWRLENFRNSGKAIKFVNIEAEKRYNTRIQRMINVYNIREPDRVPLSMMAGNLPLTMNGLEGRDIFYNPEKAFEAAMKFNDIYADKLETFSFPMGGNGQAMEILDYKLYHWPGHGLPNNSSGWQFVEGEYMTADEYDDLIRDPTDFWLRKYLPRVMGSFQPFRMFQPFTNIIENNGLMVLSPFGSPEVKNMFTNFIKAGDAFNASAAVSMKYMGVGASRGFSGLMWGEYCLAPFDIIGDTIRGTTNIMKDMFRRPQKLLAALDVVAELMISNVLNSPNIDRTLIVGYPLHKGADGWMSKSQFETFYWPSLKKLMDTFIKEGLIQSLFAEGSYNTRLDYINQFPKGSVIWYFDQTDMARAKKVLGKDCCIQGNVPSSLIVTAEAKAVKEYCKRLIDTCAPGGGYVLAPGANPENPKLENLMAMVEAVNEYGYYHK